MYKQDAVIAVINSTSYNNKQLCSLAFDCQKQFDYPIVAWNITLPSDKPKPPPRPPQPPKVNYQYALYRLAISFITSRSLSSNSLDRVT